MILDRKPYAEWSVAELKAVARKYNVKMSAADGSPRVKRGLYQAIAAAMRGHGAVRKTCHGSHGTGYCRKPGTPRRRKSRSPARRCKSRSPARRRKSCSPARRAGSPCRKTASPRKSVRPGSAWRYSDTRAGRIPQRRPTFATGLPALGFSDLAVPFNTGDKAIIQSPHQNMESLIDQGAGPGYGLNANYAEGAEVPKNYSYFGSTFE